MISMQVTKKNVATILIATLMGLALVIGFAACGGSEPDPTPPAETTQPEPTPISEPTPDPTPDPTPEPPQEESEEDFSLVGTWRWADDASYVYIFSPDGTGVRGFEWQGMQAFEWYLYEDELDIATFAMLEEWVFTVVEEEGMFFLVIESLQVPGMSFMYLFTGYIEDMDFVDYSIMLGVWSAIDEAGNVLPWDYVFFSDGSGIRGTTENFDVFYWEADYFTGELLIYLPALIEEWYITYTPDSFTAFSPDLPGIRFVYNRIN
jgi:hypothetical protein